jgi:hypothetical protein
LKLLLKLLTTPIALFAEEMGGRGTKLIDVELAVPRTSLLLPPGKAIP